MAIVCDTDQEAELIKGLVDMALKMGGSANLVPANQVLGALRVKPPESEPEKEPKIA